MLLAALGYPLAVLAALELASPRLVAGAIAVVALLRLARSPHARGRTRRMPLVVPIGAVALVVGATMLTDDERAVLFLPVAVNAALLATFAATLLRGPSMIETFATLSVGELTPDEIPYCRGWTVAWCVFFAANGGIAATLALGASHATWAAWNGFGAYVAMGAMFGAERWMRERRFPFRFGGDRAGAP